MKGLKPNTVLIVSSPTGWGGPTSITDLITFGSIEEAKVFMESYSGGAPAIFLWTGTQFLDRDLVSVDLRIILEAKEGAKVVLPHTWSEGFITGDDQGGGFTSSYMGGEEDVWDSFLQLKKDLQERQN